MLFDALVRVVVWKIMYSFDIHQKWALVNQGCSFRVVQHVVPPDSLTRPLEVPFWHGVCCAPCRGHRVRFVSTLVVRRFQP